MEGRALLGMARDNRVQEIQSAVALGVPVDFPNPIGQTALMVASLWGNLEAIQALLKLGADPNKKNEGGATPLHFAAAGKRNAAAACELLLAAGADPDIVDEMGCMPYERADDPQLRTRLGGPDQRLFDYAAANNTEGLRELLTSGAVRTVRAFDQEGRHALNVAVAQNNGTDAIQLLVEVDKDLAIMPDMTGNCALHVAAEAGAEEAAKVLIPLLSKEQLNQRNLHLSEYSQGSWSSGQVTITPWDKTALAIAVETGDEDMARLLLAAGADPNIPGFDGASCLHAAVQAQDADMARLLLENGADPNQPSKDISSCLHAIAQRGPVALLKLLLKHGADVKAVNDDGWSALHLAARAGAVEKVQVLLEAGADPGLATKQGHTALALAITNGRSAVQKALEEATAASGAVPIVAPVAS